MPDKNAIEIINTADATVLFNPSSINAQNFFEWAKSLDVGSERTLETYSRNIMRFYDYLRERDIREPTRNDVLAYRDWLKETKKPSTAHGYMVAVKLFFKWAEDQGVYPNIAKNVKSPSVSTDHKKDPLTLNQIRSVLFNIDRTTLEGLRDYALILLMVTTGLREISVVNASVSDIFCKAFDNLDTGRTEYRYYLYYKSKGHEEKDLSVVLPIETKNAIDLYLMERKRAGYETGNGAPLFTSLSNRNAGERLTSRSVRRIITTQFKDLNMDLSRISTHSLRHSFATINLLAGGSLEETQKALGHKNINTTMIYSHAITESNNRSSDRVADVLLSD